MHLRYQVLLLIFASVLVFFGPSIETANAGDKCVELLRRLLKNPPKNTNILINSRLSKARYRCRKGFKLVGKPERTCKDGRWVEKREPKCLALDNLVPCGKPDSIPHANFSGSSFNFNDKLSYSCEKGFKLKGPKRRTCREGGKWSKAPTCLLPCGKPEDIPHAKYVGSSFSFNDKLRYSCEKGYKLSGPKRRTCGKPKDGKWSKGPTCLILRCSNAANVTIRNGSVTTSDPEYVFGTTLAFECNEGYELRGSGTITCTEFGWRPARLPYCRKKRCPDPGRPENGDRLGAFTVGSTVRFSCQYGFDLYGSRERTCMENFEWDGSLTTCQDGFTDCPVLGTPISGRKYGSEYNHGDIVNFECDDGFVLKGSAVRKCMDNGTWNGTEAICKDELEDRFKDVNATAFILRKDVIDNLLEYTCNREDQIGCNKTNAQGMDTRARAINLNDKGGLDLVFVIDASSSVTRDGFKLGLNFSQELIKTIGLSKRAGGTRIALVTFGTEVKVEFNLGDAKVDTLEKAIDAIGKVNYIGGATASALALQEVRKVVVPIADKGNKRAMMFITDGKSNIGGSPEKEANYLKDKEDFEIYAIGVGRNVKVRELMAIASADDDDNHVISVRRYGSLQKAIKKAVEMKIDYSPCGESQVNLRARIVGGKNSRRGWWPWQIGIYRQKDNGIELYCGGSLISPRWVLTAAHCFYFFDHFTKKRRLFNNPLSYVIRAGDHNLTKQEKSEQERNPEKIYTHQKYEDRKFVNDIALVKLSQEVKLGKFVRTVCLPEKNEGDLAMPTKYGIATGWGATKALKPGEVAEEPDQHSTVLKYGVFTIQNDQLCSNKSVIPINSTVSFCAGDGKGGNDTCHGDSGGAFVREAQRGDEYQWVATGLVSWGDGCAQKDEYGYYTRVYPFIDWIKKTMQKNDS